MTGVARRPDLRGRPPAWRPAVLACLIAAVLCCGCPSPKDKVREDAISHENLGDQFYEKGDMESAQREYTKALEMGSQKLKVYNNLGDVNFRRGQYEAAEKYYRMALRIDPSYIFSVNNLALTLYRLQNLDEAKNMLVGAIRQSPGSALLHNSLAQILIREGDLENGIGYLRKAVELNPDYAIALNNMGDLYLKNPELGEDPLPYVMRAIEKDPDNMLFYDTLGWYYCRIGVFDEALLALGKAFIQDPENIEIRFHYATVLEWLGKEKEALEQWQVIMEMPGDRELTNAARRHYWEIKGK